MSPDDTRESTRQSPIACVPGAIPDEQRTEHFALIGRLFGGALRERREIPEGCAFRFDEDAFADVASFVENERRCCPFLTFALELAPEHGTLWLRLTGPGGACELVLAELLGPRAAVDPAVASYSSSPARLQTTTSEKPLRGHLLPTRNDRMER